MVVVVVVKLEKKNFYIPHFLHRLFNLTLRYVTWVASFFFVCVLFLYNNNNKYESDRIMEQLLMCKVIKGG